MRFTRRHDHQGPQTDSRPPTGGRGKVLAAGRRAIGRVLQALKSGGPRPGLAPLLAALLAVALTGAAQAARAADTIKWSCYHNDRFTALETANRDAPGNMYVTRRSTGKIKDDCVVETRPSDIVLGRDQGQAPDGADPRGTLFHLPGVPVRTDAGLPVRRVRHRAFGRHLLACRQDTGDAGQLPGLRQDRVGLRAGHRGEDRLSLCDEEERKPQGQALRGDAGRL
jgi:hypothetical protein